MTPYERDLELSNKVINGDTDSFNILLGDARSKIRGRAIKAVGCIDAAEDIAQQTIINAYVKLDKFRGESTFASWIYTITTNCIRMYLRTRRRIEKNEAKVSMNENTAMVDARTPLNDVELLQVCDIIEDAMDYLAPKYREVIELWITGISIHDMAVYLDISAPAVKSKMHRARKYMKAYIVEEYGKSAVNEIF